jgi:hypothetical protein
MLLYHVENKYFLVNVHTNEVYSVERRNSNPSMAETVIRGKSK